jgi:peptidoglycan hydrolase-like protein with peptidoglycan-binding domain
MANPQAPRQLNQAQKLDQLNRYMTMTSAQNQDAARCRAEWAAWYDSLGWHERHMDPRTFVIGKACCIRFIACNGSSFGAERRTLRQGMTGEDVKTMQGIVGVPAANQDGNFGPGTQRAVIAWQLANGLTADGVFGPASWAKADSASSGGPISDAERERILGLVALTSDQSYRDSEGARNEEKMAMIAKKEASDPNANIPLIPSTAVGHPTIRLWSKGDAVKEWQKILGMEPDGNFGYSTESNTKAFQVKNNLQADGIVGPKTWMAAYSSYSAQTNVAPPGAVVDSTGTLPPAMAPTTAQVLARPPGASVMARPVGQPIKTSTIKQILQKSPKTAPPKEIVLKTDATAGHAGTFIQQAGMSWWNPMTWSGPQKVVGGLAAIGVLFFGSRSVAEYNAKHR